MLLNREETSEAERMTGIRESQRGGEKPGLVKRGKGIFRKRMTLYSSAVNAFLTSL